MDDLAVFAPTKPRLQTVLAALRRFLHERLRLQLREERTLLAPVTQCRFSGCGCFRDWCGWPAGSWRDRKDLDHFLKDRQRMPGPVRWRVKAGSPS